VYKGRVLEDDASLGYCEVKSGDCIIGIKTKVVTRVDPATAAAAAAAAATAAQAQAPGLPTSSVATVVFDAAMHELLAHNGENLPGVQACVATLLRICENVISQPMVDKFRRVPSTNATFRTKVGLLQGGPAAMRALGFALNEATADWTLVPSAEAWENLVACHDKLSRFQKRLLLGGGGGGSGAGLSAAQGGDATSSSNTGSTATATATATGSTGAGGSAGTTEKVSSDEGTAGAASTAGTTDSTAQQVLLLAMALAAKNNTCKDAAGADDGEGAAAAKDPGAGA